MSHFKSCYKKKKTRDKFRIKILNLNVLTSVSGEQDTLRLRLCTDRLILLKDFVKEQVGDAVQRCVLDVQEKHGRLKEVSDVQAGSDLRSEVLHGYFL